MTCTVVNSYPVALYEINCFSTLLKILHTAPPGYDQQEYLAPAPQFTIYFYIPHSIEHPTQPVPLELPFFFFFLKSVGSAITITPIPSTWRWVLPLHAFKYPILTMNGVCVQWHRVILPIHWAPPTSVTRCCAYRTDR